MNIQDMQIKIQNLEQLLTDVKLENEKLRSEIIHLQSIGCRLFGITSIGANTNDYESTIRSKGSYIDKKAVLKRQKKNLTAKET